MWIFQNNEGFFTTNNSLKLENNRLLSSLLEDLSSLPRILFIDIVYLFARFFNITDPDPELICSEFSEASRFAKSLDIYEAGFYI